MSPQFKSVFSHFALLLFGVFIGVFAYSLVIDAQVVKFHVDNSGYAKAETVFFHKEYYDLGQEGDTNIVDYYNASYECADDNLTLLTPTVSQTQPLFRSLDEIKKYRSAPRGFYLWKWHPLHQRFFVALEFVNPWAYHIGLYPGCSYEKTQIHFMSK